MSNAFAISSVRRPVDTSLRTASSRGVTRAFFPKDHVKGRLGYSPDLGDAHALTFAIHLHALARRGQRNERQVSAPGWAA